MGLLRLWLALCVVATHSTGDLGFSHLHGASAVCIFFVLAGFFGAHMLETRYRSRYRVFYLNRVLRIWPLYLAVLAASVALMLYAAGQGVLLGPARNLPPLGGLPSAGGLVFWGFTQVFLLGQDVSYFLNFPPQGGRLFWACGDPLSPNLGYLAILSATWSLAVEEYFYLLAPWFYRIATGLAVGIFAFWLVAYQRLYTACAFYPTYLPLFGLMPFFGGIASYRFYLRFQGTWLQQPWLRWAIPAAYALFLISAGSLHLGIPTEVLLSALALPWVFDLSRDRAWDRWVGDLSYPLYLVHLPVLWLLAWKLPAWGGGAGMACSVLVAAAVAGAVERPLRALRARLAEKK